VFDVGFWELTLIMVIVLIVVGPERLPRLARTAGLWIAKVRRMVGDVKAEVERELRAEELRGHLEKGALDDLKRAAGEVRAFGRDLQRDLSKSQRPAAPAATPDLGSPVSGSSVAKPATAAPTEERDSAAERKAVGGADGGGAR